MMRQLFVLLVFFAAAPLSAETGYVTDQLNLGIHRASDTSDRPFRQLRSGESFEIISRNGYYAHVRLPDGEEGYVKVAYVVTDKPAALIVEETAAERDSLSAELEDLKSAFAEPAARMETLQSEAETLRVDLATATDRAETLEAENARLVARAQQYQHSLPYTWVAGAALICLVAGVLLGHWWIDRQSRRRHGGIRVI